MSHRTATMQFAAVGWGLLLFAYTAVAADANVQIIPAQATTNFFADSDQRLTFEIASDGPLKGRFTWVYAAGQRTIARGEGEIDGDAKRAVTVGVALRLPPVNDGVVFRTQLSLAVVGADVDEPLATLGTSLWLFPKDPLVDRAPWLKKLDIALYDPAGGTVELFDKIELPFKLLRNLAAVEQHEEGLLVVGEGLSLDDEKQLSEVVLAKAAMGTPVLWLSPAAGDLPLASVVGAKEVERIDWRRHDVVAALDKRLDDGAWSAAGGLPARGLRLLAEDDGLFARVSDDPAAWPWLEVKYQAPRAKFIVCGLSLIEAWPQSPTPRFLFVRILEEFAADPPETTNPAVKE